MCETWREQVELTTMDETETHSKSAAKKQDERKNQ